MTDTSETLMSAEMEMAKAVERINSSISDLENFKTATQTLSDVASKSTAVLSSLSGAAQVLHDGAKQLNEEGIVEFNNTLTNSITSVQNTMSQHVSAIETDITSKLSKTYQRLSEHVSTSRDDLITKMNKKIAGLQAIVVVLGVLNLALLLYVAFGANWFS